jgi:hypothetical protein
LAARTIGNRISDEEDEEPHHVHVPGLPHTWKQQDEMMLDEDGDWIIRWWRWWMRSQEQQ